MDPNNVPTALPQGKTLDAKDAKSRIDHFTPSMNYTDAARNGVGVTAGTYKGQQVVTAGPAWHKDVFEDGSMYIPLFKRGACSMTPDQADAFADAIKAAAAKARTLTPAQEEPIVQTARKTGKGSDLDVIKEMFDNALSGIAQRLTRLETTSGVASATNTAPVANSLPATTSEASSSNNEDSEGDPRFESEENLEVWRGLNADQANLFTQLIESGVTPDTAVNMVAHAVV